MTSTPVPLASPSNPTNWSPESNPPAGYLSRKALPIKKTDAEPLTRDDVQYDLLNHIFSNPKAVFTDPFSKRAEKVTFSGLYISALAQSPKCSKVLKDKMVETPEFATELGKISLLTNVGRINTTMAFFPEMRTALRTYHPVPSLQKTDGNAQDAPRIKNCLKAALLPSESKGIPPATPEEVLAKQLGQHPPTSVVNLIFVLSTHAAPLSDKHFDGNLNFIDLFIPGKGLASYERAQAFLWLIYHYLETADGHNPFSDKYAQRNPGKAPQLRRLGPNERPENVDTDDEIRWGRVMSGKRNAFLQQLVSSLEYERRTGRNAPPVFISVTPKGESGRRSQRQSYDTPREEGSFLYYVPSQESTTSTRSERPPGSRNHPLTTVTEAEVSLGPRLKQRSMLEHAWISANKTDPLDDSDTERTESEHVLLDYGRRLKVLRNIQDSEQGHRSFPNHL